MFTPSARPGFIALATMVALCATSSVAIAQQIAPGHTKPFLPGKRVVLPGKRPQVERPKVDLDKTKPTAQKQDNQTANQPATPPEPVAFRWANEEFYFSVSLNGIEAVRAGIRAGDVRYKDGHPYVAVAGTAQSTGIFDSIYPVNDRAHTFLNPVTLRPLRSQKFFEEAGSSRAYHVDFVHSTYRAKVKKEKGEKTRKFTKAIPGTTNDMITWFYELRRRQDLRLGEKMSFFVYDGWRLYRLDAVVAAREDTYTPIGWFKTFRIDVQRSSLRTKRQKGESPIITVASAAKPKGSLWVSRDENLIPVKVSVATQWGVGEAVLIKYKLPSQTKKD